jgi:hypothetical protein
MSTVQDLSRKAKKHIKENNLKLPPRFKEKWLEALASGKYEKGKDFLCNLIGENKHDYCCLGVAGRIQGVPISLLEEEGYLTEPISNLAKNRKKPIPKVLHGDNPVTSFLSFRNDTSKTFKEVRTWIEKNL